MTNRPNFHGKVDAKPRGTMGDVGWRPEIPVHVVLRICLQDAQNAAEMSTRKRQQINLFKKVRTVSFFPLPLPLLA